MAGMPAMKSRVHDQCVRCGLRSRKSGYGQTCLKSAMGFVHRWEWECDQDCEVEHYEEEAPATS